MTKGKSMMGPGSDKNTEFIKLNRRAGICMLRKGKKVSRKCIFRKVDANNSSYNYCVEVDKITFENCLPCPAKSP